VKNENGSDAGAPVGRNFSPPRASAEIAPDNGLEADWEPVYYMEKWNARFPCKKFSDTTKWTMLGLQSMERYMFLVSSSERLTTK